MLELGRPLHGDTVYSLKISTANGTRELVQRRYAMEFDLAEIVSSTQHRDHEGIFVIDLFEAARHNSGSPTTLEATMQRNLKSQRFLVSGVANRLMVATSRIGYPESGRYGVVDSRYVEGYEFDMLDLASSSSDDSLLYTHVARVEEHGGDVNTIPEFDIENLFRNVALFSPERP